MVCPMSSEWWEGIANEVYYDEMKDLIERVEQFAANSKGEKEARKFVENGGWKARVGGKGLPNGGNRVKERIDKNNLVFTIQNPKQKWTDVAAVLGVIVEQKANNFVQRIGNKNYEFHLKQDDNSITVNCYPFSTMDRFEISKLRGVASKVAYCIGCKACTVQCPTGAFSIQSDGRIVIRERFCTHCGNCLMFNERSCLVAENLRVPEGGFMNMKGIDPYHHFGLRQAWLAHFMEQKEACFSQGVLGTVQYSALKIWLKEANMLDVVKEGNATNLVVTELGEKLIKMGPYNPFVWAIIWSNLAYNSTICHWYCLNTEIGAAYEKGDLVVMLGDQLSKANRENAVTALTDTLRQTPIGSALQQGMPLELSKNSYSFLRSGWGYPHAVALLYALYLYAEKTGRKSFTFTELLNAHSNPDAVGMSPADIFGIEAKTFREHLQGLAVNFPKYIRVSFIANLDNIILEDYTSLDVLDLAED